ncbi:MAG: response regulator [Candidatus Dormibacteraceae bacterium]
MSQRVLIVDDEPSGIDLLTQFLAHTDAEIRSLTDSRKVEEVFAEFAPDIVLLDLHMPQPDGFEVLHLLRGLRSRMVFVPVIVLTADKERSARNRALVLGADDFLTKPLDRDEVRLRVRNLLHTRRLHIELAEYVEALERRTGPGNADL